MLCEEETTARENNSSGNGNGNPLDNNGNPLERQSRNQEEDQQRDAEGTYFLLLFFSFGGFLLLASINFIKKNFLYPT